ncbi:C40 family peptidase [Aquibacillus kalidii]|uniref:hypothetical protein n=1 Tax=Aquibacillus kalidii TaxID=2762597 RepID=UPI001C994DBD|nr:hypothetical protein [Aquibacillus kalidii]
MGGGKMRKTHFRVIQQGEWLYIENTSNLPIYNVEVYVNQQRMATSSQANKFYVRWDNNQDIEQLMVIGYSYNNNRVVPVAEEYSRNAVNMSQAHRERNFKAGDILVASDNVNEIMTGYMGHSAIVVDENNLIESPGGYPAIRKDSVQQFLEKHPQHAQFRPKSKEQGEAAASYAKEYLASYKKKVENGTKKPVFSFNLSQSLQDPWEYIYCSKLVWLAYYNGADYKFSNDHLWFSPEDLYSILKDNKDFEKVYEHKDVKFQLDT